VKGQKYILKSKQAAAAAIILILSAHPIDYSAWLLEYRAVALVEGLFYNCVDSTNIYQISLYG